MGGQAAWESWQRVRASTPLVQCLTNLVSMDLMANTLLCSGASPAMVHSVDEAAEFTALSSALLLNVGTLSSDWVAAMKLTAMEANRLGTPWVLDPVGAGATRYRTAACVDLLRLRPTVLRGNGSEILALSGADAAGKGADSLHSADDAAEAAMNLALQYQCITAVTGAVDLVTDGKMIIRVSNGVPMLTNITAAGCSVTAVVAAFVACAPPDQRVAAAAHALAIFGLAAEEAARDAKGPGSLRAGLLDQLFTMDQATV